jgi:lysozyme
LGGAVVNESLTTSRRGESLIQEFENCIKAVSGRRGHFTTYVCPAGVLTIGWGHTNANGRQFKAGDVWTQGECDAALREDIAVAERAVRRRVKVALTQSQFDALAAFIMNCGEGNFAKSTLLRKINAKDFEGAADEFAKWNRGGGKVLRGLTRRRAAEAALFRDGAHETVRVSYRVEARQDPEVMPQGVDAPDGQIKPMSTSKIGNSQMAHGTGGLIEGASAVKAAVEYASELKQGVDALGMGDVLAHLVTMPSFWIAVGIIAVAGAAWYWRREHAQAGI